LRGIGCEYLELTSDVGDVFPKQDKQTLKRFFHLDGFSIYDLELNHIVYFTLR
jgi:hypothetical protein